MIYYAMILFLLPTAAGLSMPFNVYTFSAAERNFIRAYEKTACPADKVTCEGKLSAVKGIEYSEAFINTFRGDTGEFCEWFKGERRSIQKIFTIDDIIIDRLMEDLVEEPDWKAVGKMSIYYTGFKQC